MTEEEEHLFQQCNNCWICKNLVDNDHEQVRDHCHITSRFRGAAPWDCNINVQLTKKVPVIFHNLKGYDFKYLVKEFDSENLELLKQGAYLYEYMNSFKRFNEEKLPARKCFFSSKKDGKIGDAGKKSDDHICLKIT